jgi:prevent-host-death family protein
MSDPSFAAIRSHYELNYEDARLREGIGRLEFARVQEIVRRQLPGSCARVLDVGGATGVHAEWLLADGHQVQLIDPMPGHVEQAKARLGQHSGFSAEVADARRLPAPDDSVDMVLLFGPLYHLIERADRLLAWQEAGRVVRRGGLVLGMGISRFASLFDGLAKEFLFDPEFRALVAQDLATGRHENPTGDPRWFTSSVTATGTIFGTTRKVPMSITASEARKNLFPLIEQVNDDRTPIEITSRRGDAVLMSRADYEALEETAHLLRSPANARRLLESLRQAHDGDRQERALSQ